MEKAEKILQHIENINKDNKYWIIGRETGSFLAILIQVFRPKVFVEIGTGSGYSGIFIARELKKFAGHLYTVESHNERFNLAKKHFKEAGLSKYITQIKGHAPEVLGEIKKKFDFVFFDATKYEHNLYFDFCYPKLKKGSILTFDNAISHKKELSSFFTKLNKIKDLKGDVLPIGNGIGVYRKI